MIALAALQLFDKGKRSADPTFTFDIRRAWRATAQMRLRQLRGRMRIAIIDHDVLALGGADSVMGYHPKATRLNAFSKWLEAMGAQALVSDWSTPYVTKAWQSGVIAAHKQTVATIGAEVDDQDMIVVRVQQELRGIAAALAQQVSREADKVLSMSRPQAFRQLAKIFDKVAVNRLNAMCNTFTVTAHNKAKLAVFRAAGHSHVGVMPESIAGGRKGHSHIRDAFNPDEERNAKGEWTIGSAADIPNAFQLKMIIAGMKPAIKMVRDFQGRKKDEILVGKRGDWHNDVAKANNIKPIDVDYHFGVDGEMPIYERGFVFPWSNTYYSARDIGVDAAELRGAGGRGHASEDSFDLSLVKGNSLMLDRPMSSEEDEDIVGVLTADDDDVCELCENIAADGPYTLDEAYDLIGDTHPNCRCSVYPWGDNQYVGDGIRIDDFDPNEARDPLGMWTAGGESRSADRISTRVPYAAKTDFSHTSSALMVGIESSRASGKAFESSAKIIGAYPFMRAASGSSPTEVTDHFVAFAKSNILALYDAIPEATRVRSKTWYDGANKIAHRWAEKYNVNVRAVAATMAALSPQKDWNQNADLARRMLEIWTTRDTQAFTPEMATYANKYIAAIAKDGVAAAAKGNNKFAATKATTVKLMHGYVKEFTGKTLADFDKDAPDKQAVFLRWLDEAHNSRDYPIITPEGEAGAIAKNLPNKKDIAANTKVAWGTYAAMGNAISVMRDPSIENISRSMGGNHKVRNFYNNIIAPNDTHGDVTVDTHAIAAAVMHPLSGNDMIVKQGLGTVSPSDAATGSQGLYGLYAEAYRQAAKERNVLPRQIQSVTWEAIRGLFTPEQKSSGVVRADVEKIWNGYKEGRYDQHEVQRQIIAAGIIEPDWKRNDTAHDAQARNGNDAASIYGDFNARDRSGGLDSRDGDGNSRRTWGLDTFDPNEMRDPKGEWTTGGGSWGGATTFVSPNRTNLTFEQAKVMLGSKEQKIFSLTCDGIDTDLDIKADDHSAIGAWADGAENSLMIRMPGATHDEAVIASALKGYTADQKSVLLFEPHATGDAYMAMFKAQGNVDDIHAGLLHDGVAFHTLLPVSDGSVVCIFGSDNETLHAISKAAQRYDASIEFTRGHGEFIGTQKEDGTDREQRDDARQIYATIIQGSIIAGKLRGRDLAATWGKVRAHSAAI